MGEDNESFIERMRRMDAGRIKKVHSICIRYGKTYDKGVRDEGSLFNISSALQEMARAGESVVSIAAFAIERIVKDHHFWDGNHRTAYEMGRFILILSDYRLNVTVSEAVVFMREIDSSNLSRE